MFDGLSDPGRLSYSLDNFSYGSQVTGPFGSFGAEAIATNGNIAFGRSITLDGPNSMYHFVHTPELGVQAFTTYTDSVETFRNTVQDADWVVDTFIGVGPIGSVGLSDDGLAWSEISSPNLGFLRRVVPTADGGFVAVGDMETILLGSTDALGGTYPAWPESVSCIDLIMTVNNCP